MRCLQCGTQLGTLKKITDGEFCSAEHRQVYQEEMNRLMVERLTKTGTRLRRNRLARESAPRSAEAPAFGDFIALQRSEPRDWQIELLSLGVLASTGTDLTIPLLEYGGIDRGPRRLRIAGQIAIELISCDAAVPLRALGCEPQVTVEQAHPTLTWRRVPALGQGGLFRMRPRKPVGGEHFPRLQASATEVAGFESLVRWPGYAAAVGECGLSLHDRIFRPRPRGPVVDPGIASGLQAAIAVEPLAGGVELPRLLVASSELAPQGATRFFRPRPRGPVADAGLADAIGAQATIEPLTGRPAIPARQAHPLTAVPPSSQRFAHIQPEGQGIGATPGILASPVAQAETMPGAAAILSPRVTLAYAPSAVTRLFRPRPRGPVADPSMSGYTAADHSTEQMISPALLPGLRAAGSDASPRRSTAPISVPLQLSAVEGRGLALSLPVDSTAETLRGDTAKPGFRSHSALLAPSMLHRLFRPRPRGPVADAAVAGTANLGAGAAPLSGTAAVPLLNCGLSPLAPPPSPRLFRPRPRGPVADASLSNTLVSGMPLECMPGEPALIGLPPGAASGTFAPRLSQRLFRPRPRGPVADASLSNTLVSGMPLEGMPGGPALIGLPPAAAFGMFAPRLSQRLFRPRPRGPVADPKLTAALGLGTHIEALTGGLAVPSIAAAIAAPSPAAITRLFRPRPLGPIAMAADLSGIDGTTAVFASSPLLPATGNFGSACAPKALSKFFRARPRLSDEAPSPKPILAAPVLPGSPESGEVPGPVFGDHTIRMRFQDFSIRVREKLPEFDGMMALPRPAGAVGLAAAGAGALAIPDLAGFISFPSLGLSPIEPKKLPSVEVRQTMARYAPNGLAGTVSRVWNRIPSDRRWIAIVGPLVVVLFMHNAFSGNAEPPRQAVQTADVAANPVVPIRNTASGPLASIRQSLRERAAVDISDNFVDGFAQWQGDGDWAKTWSTSASGAQPGALALLTPSLKLHDYRLEFTGSIVKKGLSWVVRAADLRNHQVVKLQVVKPGPMPTVAVVRYAVVDGQEGPKTTTNLPFPVSSEAIYRVAMDVKDDSFALTVQDKVVDFWSEAQLKTGGAGFFGAKGEQARIQSVRITHQNDTLGRMFAKLSPGNVEAKDGSSKIDESEK